MKAYMFVNAMRGQSMALTKALRSLEGVTGADAITGDYDIVATVEARDLSELRATMTGVQQIDGILKTTTCMVLSEG
jgi:DNA-binding Lrp family transcriptional regulator